MAYERKEQFERLKLKAYDNWELYLFEHQDPYLGRCAAVNTRQDAETYFDMTDEEALELKNTVIAEWADAVNELWPFDKENIASLGNDFRHLHWHLIPRRKPGNTPKVNDHTFTDLNWGRNYKPVEYGDVPDDTTLYIRDQMRDALNSPLDTYPR